MGPCAKGDDFNGRPVLPAASSSAASSPLDHDSAATTSNPLLHTKTAQKILRAQKQPPGPTLFLGNLGFEATEDSIRDMLGSHRVRVRYANVNASHEQDDGKNESDVVAASAAAASAAATSDKWIRKVRMGTFEDSGKCKG